MKKLNVDIIVELIRQGGSCKNIECDDCVFSNRSFCTRPATKEEIVERLENLLVSKKLNLL